MSGNVSKMEELGQCSELVGSVAKAMALVAPRMTRCARQSWIGLPPSDFARVLERQIFLPNEQFERNEHGHIVLEFEGLDISGDQEIERLIAAGFRVSDWTKPCLTSTKKDGYDKNHRLVAGQRYRVALLPIKEIERNSGRTTDALRKRGIEKYGYEKPLAGIVPRIRETVSDKQMEEMGFWYIAAPHDTIEDSDGDPIVLGTDRSDDGPWLSADWDLPGLHWRDSGAFAFLVPKLNFAI